MTSDDDEAVVEAFVAEVEGLDVAATLADEREGYRRSVPYDRDGRPTGGGEFDDGWFGDADGLPEVEP